MNYSSSKARAYASPKALHDASFTAARDGWHLGALVLVTTSGPSLTRRAGFCPAQTPRPRPKVPYVPLARDLGPYPRPGGLPKVKVT